MMFAGSTTTTKNKRLLLAPSRPTPTQLPESWVRYRLLHLLRESVFELCNDSK